MEVEETHGHKCLEEERNCNRHVLVLESSVGAIGHHAVPVHGAPFHGHTLVEELLDTELGLQRFHLL